ncbi:MAG: DUF2076 domain-containing protein [Chromatiaceae bacterium]|nr:DUF2076 domain-containing protein [Chromatiaceae bacterium]
MNAQEQTAIEELFQRLRQAEAQSGPRDAEAEALIRNLVSSQPVAPYLMAQAVLVQEHALRNQQARIEELEKQLAARPQQQAPQASGGFLGGLFGGGAPQPPAPPAHPPAQAASRGGWGAGRSTTGQQPGMAAPFQQGGGGGFMSGALQTAMGVAGGVLLGNAIAGMFSSDPVEAAELPAEPEMPVEPEFGAEEMPMDEGAFLDDFGGEEF